MRNIDQPFFDDSDATVAGQELPATTAKLETEALETPKKTLRNRAHTIGTGVLISLVSMPVGAAFKEKIFDSAHAQDPVPTAEATPTPTPGSDTDPVTATLSRKQIANCAIKATDVDTMVTYAKMQLNKSQTKVRFAYSLKALSSPECDGFDEQVGSRILLSGNAESVKKNEHGQMWPINNLVVVERSTSGDVSGVTKYVKLRKDSRIINKKTGKLAYLPKRKSRAAQTQISLQLEGKIDPETKEHTPLYEDSTVYVRTRSGTFDTKFKQPRLSTK